MIDEPRVAKSGRSLPSARLVSLNLYDEKEDLSPVITLLHMTFGQFLDHDIARTAVKKFTFNDSITGRALCIPFFSVSPLLPNSHSLNS